MQLRSGRGARAVSTARKSAEVESALDKAPGAVLNTIHWHGAFAEPRGHGREG